MQFGKEERKEERKERESFFCFWIFEKKK